jgi:5-methylthioribose kinase
VRAFDAEFGAYGPVGFDLGMLWGNYVLAAARAAALGAPARARALLDLGRTTWTAFEGEWRALWPSRLDPRVYGDGVLESQLTGFWRDAVTYAGTETVRRVVGFAKVADVETLPEAERVVAARGALRAAHALLVDEPPSRRADVLRELASGPLGV